jgi:Ger(x)C family germination protein
MKPLISIVTICLCFVLSGCGDQIYLERSDIILMLGIDLDENNQLTVYASIPVFSTEVKKNYHVLKVKAKSLREARYQLDSLSQGSIMKGKIQVILLGKKLLQNRSVLPYLDVILRDPKDDLNSRVVMVNGTIDDVLHANMDDKGRLSVVLRNMIDTTFESGIIANPTLQQFNAQHLDDRFTPMIPEIRVKNKELKISGMSLLTRDGKYITSLNLHESPLALVLQTFFTKQIPISLYISSNKIKKKTELRHISIGIKNIKRKITTRIVNNQYQFDVHYTIRADLVERMFFLDSESHPHLLKKIIEQQLNYELNKFIRRTQENEIDPIGFGVYARANHYKHWKKIQKHWCQEYAKAKIQITSNVIIDNTGGNH